MSKITELTIERFYTINLGNFESAKLGASATVQVSSGDDPNEVYEDTVAFLEEKLMGDMDALGDGDED